MSKDTEKRIEQAIVRVSKGRGKIVAENRKLSISAVAEEAGLHRSTIINRYPLLADKIRIKCGYSNDKLNNEASKILKLEFKLKQANKEIESLRHQLAKAISIQAKNILTAVDFKKK